ncbi:hypothetical protein [Streptomyces sp. NPDC001089]
MGQRLDRLREAVITHTTDSEGTPTLARHATQACSMAANTAHQHHNTAAAVGISLLGAAAVAAEGALSNYVYPKGEYATFKD